MPRPKKGGRGEPREVTMKRIMDSKQVRTGEAFLASDMGRHLTLSTSTTSLYLKQLVRDRQLKVKMFGQKMLYSKNQMRIMSISWRIDESVYEELEEALCDL